MNDFITETLEEYDRLTNSENFKVDNDYTLLGVHLFDSCQYPESPYELDPDKVKSFFTTKLTEAIAQERKEFKKTLESLIEEIPDTTIFRSMKTGENLVKSNEELKQQLRAKYLAPPK